MHIVAHLASKGYHCYPLLHVLSLALQYPIAVDQAEEAQCAAAVPRNINVVVAGHNLLNLQHCSARADGDGVGVTAHVDALDALAWLGEGLCVHACIMRLLDAAVNRCYV